MMGNESRAVKACLAALLHASPLIGMLLARWSEIELPDVWLGAGCIAQSVWNALAGNPPAHHVRDIDFVYFDADDLSGKSEAAHERRLRSIFADVDIPLDVKNQARVHLWYAKRFGKSIAPYGSIEEAVRTWPTTATSIAVRPGEKLQVSVSDRKQLEVCAPFGLEDLFAGIVRPNKTLVDEKVYLAKAERWRACWPGLRFEPW